MKKKEAKSRGKAPPSEVAAPTSSTPPRKREEKDFLTRGRSITSDVEELRRQNLVRLVGSDRFPTWKALADALGYKDQSRLSHLKQGYRHISASLARGMESELDLEPGYFDVDPNKTGARSVLGEVDRRAAAQRYLAREASARELAKEYEVEEATIYRWVAEYRQEEDTAITARHRALTPDRTPSERSVADLEEENRRLKDQLLATLLERNKR